jgi:hypothetical protein
MYLYLFNDTMFKFQLLYRTEGFLIYGILKCFHEHTAYGGKYGRVEMAHQVWCLNWRQRDVYFTKRLRF